RPWVPGRSSAAGGECFVRWWGGRDRGDGRGDGVGQRGGVATPVPLPLERERAAVAAPGEQRERGGERQRAGALQDGGGVLPGGDLPDLHVPAVVEQVGQQVVGALLERLTDPPGVQQVPDRADARVVGDAVEHAGDVAPAGVGVVGLDEDADAEVGGLRGGGGEHLGGAGVGRLDVGDRGQLVGGHRRRGGAGEDPHVTAAEVGGELQVAAQRRRRAGVGGGDLDPAGDREHADAGVGEGRAHLGALARGQADVDGGVVGGTELDGVD